MSAWQAGRSRSAEASLDEAEKTQFRFSGKKGRGINNGYFFPCITVLLEQLNFCLSCNPV